MFFPDPVKVIQVEVFSVVTPCSVVGYRRFGRPCYLQEYTAS